MTVSSIIKTILLFINTFTYHSNTDYNRRQQVENKMRVMLISPSITSYKKNLKRIIPPMSLGYLGAVIRGEFSINILDAALEGYKNERAIDKELMVYGLEDSEIEQRIANFRPKVVGVTLPFSSQVNNSINICKIAKKNNSNIKTVVGGIHASVMYEDVLENKEIDFVVIGEGEKTLLELCRNIRDNKSIEGIKGLSYKVNGKVLVTGKRKLILNPDELPFPARDIMNMDKYFKINIPHGSYAKGNCVGSVLTSRGCPGVCTYCSSHVVAGYKFRARSAENVLAEIEELVNKYNVNEIQFEDDNLTFDKERAVTLFQGMKKFNLIWCTPNGISINAIDFAENIRYCQ